MTLPCWLIISTALRTIVESVCLLMQDNTGKLEAAGVASLPEFVDHKGLKALFGRTRFHAYLLADQGSIRSVCIRRPGAIRGRRLFDCQSIRDFLAKNVDNRASGEE